MNIENARKIIDDSTTMTAVEVLAFTEAIEQLAEAKRLLKLAVEDLKSNDIIISHPCSLCKFGDDSVEICQSKPRECFVWVHTEEAEKLLKEAENG